MRLHGEKNGTAKFWAAVTSVCITILGAGFWVISTVGSIRTDVAVLTEHVEHLNYTVESAMDDRFRGTDWRANKMWIDAEFVAIKARLKALE